MTNRIKFEVKDGLFSPPIFNDKPGAKNWAAITVPSFTAHGGDAKRFLNGPDIENSLLPIDDLIIGEAIEFAADGIDVGPKGGKRKFQKRWFGVVRSVSPTEVEIEQFDDQWDAFRATDRGQARQRGEGLSTAELRARQKLLHARLDALDDERRTIGRELVELEAQLALDDMIHPIPEWPDVHPDELDEAEFDDDEPTSPGNREPPPPLPGEGLPFESRLRLKLAETRANRTGKRPKK